MIAVPGISIVINNYNYARFLRRAIESALSQVCEAREVIVVDDGSSDDSVDIIRSFGEQIRPIFKANGGQASAFNAGIAAADGEWVLFLDADDYLFPHATEILSAELGRDVAQIQFWLTLVDEAENIIGALRPDFVDGDSLERLGRTGKFHVNPTSANLFRRKDLVAIHPLPEPAFRICADALLISRMATRGPVFGIRKELAAYRVHGGNNFFLTKDSLADADVEKVVQNALLQRKVFQEALATRGLKLPPDFRLKSLNTLEAIEMRRRIDKAGLAKLQPLMNLLLGMKGKRPVEQVERLALSAYAGLLRYLPWGVLRGVIAARRKWFPEPQPLAIQTSDNA